MVTQPLKSHVAAPQLSSHAGPFSIHGWLSRSHLSIPNEATSTYCSSLWTVTQPLKSHVAAPQLSSHAGPFSIHGWLSGSHLSIPNEATSTYYSSLRIVTQPVKLLRRIYGFRCADFQSSTLCPGNFPGSLVQKPCRNHSTYLTKQLLHTIHYCGQLSSQSNHAAESTAFVVLA
jgi:hypothetical protein